jgi:hypothetical protein
MTIVLQHQFRDLAVGEDAFSVTLRFGGVLERLHVPFAALVAFADPAAKFGLRLEPGAAAASGPGPEGPTSAPALATEGTTTEPAAGNVVDIRSFRRRDEHG